MGYVDLAIKAAQVAIYVFVKVSLGLMWVFPWRKNTQMKDWIAEVDKSQGNDSEERIFVKAGIVLYVGLQTFLDLPFLLLIAPLALLSPYRIPSLSKRLKTLPPTTWRMDILNQYLQFLIDLPYILMLIVILLSVFMAIKMKRRVQKKLLDDKKLTLADIFRHEIFYHFGKLIFVYIIGLAIFIILNLVYCITALLTVWRLK